MTSTKKEIKGKESWRDLAMTKICATCGISYHPRNNRHQITSRYCSVKCVKDGRKKRGFVQF